MPRRRRGRGGRGGDGRAVVETSAGGVIYRWAGGTAHILLIRDRYRHWGFPKGHVEGGETAADAALREVWEETGLRCRLGRELEAVRYEVKGRPKLVRYWVMDVVEDAAFVPNDEVDELRWCPREEAERLLTYAHDRELVASL